MKTIHITATIDVENEIISELMNILIKNGFKTQKYLGVNSKIVMAKLLEEGK
jgi:glycine betaine/choline ABC-type transport system substrate-binding protein